MTPRDLLEGRQGEALNRRQRVVETSDRDGDPAGVLERAQGPQRRLAHESVTMSCPESHHPDRGGESGLANGLGQERILTRIQRAQDLRARRKGEGESLSRRSSLMVRPQSVEGDERRHP